MTETSPGDTSVGSPAPCEGADTIRPSRSLSALTVSGVPTYQSVRRIAEGVAEILKEADDPKCPLYLTLDLDIAKSLGGILKDEFKVARDIIAVDGIEVGDLDYIDIGECLGITEVIPVTVKSLMFPTTQAD